MRLFGAALLWLAIVVAIAATWNPARWAVSIPEITVYSAAALLLVTCAAGWRKPVWSSVMIPLAAIVLWGLLQLSIGASVYAWRTKLSILYWSANLAVFFIARQVFSDSRIRRVFFDALLAFGLILAILSPIQALDPTAKIFWIFPIPAGAMSAFGPFLNPNQYSALVELLLPMALYRAVTSERRVLYPALMVSVLYASAIATSSRMGFFLTTAEMIATPALVMWRRKIPLQRVRSGAFFFAAILIMLAAAAGPDTLATKLSTNDPYAGRREYTEASIAMVKDRPLLGFGLGTWATVYPEFAQNDDGLFINQAHDDWAQWAAEGGLPFFGLMLSVALWSGRYAWKTGWGLGVVAIFIHCLADYPLLAVGVSMAVFATMGAMAAEADRNRKDLDLKNEEPRPAPRLSPAA